MITQNYVKGCAQNFGFKNLILDGFVPEYPWKFHYCVNFQVKDSPLQIKILLAVDGAYSHAHTTNSNSTLYFGKFYLVLHTPLIAIFQM